MPNKNWCFQIINHAEEEERQLLYIYEVYYLPTGEISHISADPVAPFGESTKALQTELENMKECFGLPILQWKDVKDKVKQILVINK